ncbi:MAG: 50S ribosomal protein L24 [Micavibrio sp.]|nr:50S ribosomal protein L24 [Micavibrio sp.]
MKIKKGDNVIVTTGANKGAKGEVLKVDIEKSKVLVQGVNMRVHHSKPTQTSPGGIERKEAYLHVSNVSLIDPKKDKATRIGYKTLENGTKVRYAKASGETLD